MIAALRGPADKVMFHHDPPPGLPDPRLGSRDLPPAAAAAGPGTRPEPEPAAVECLHKMENCAEGMHTKQPN